MPESLSPEPIPGSARAAALSRDRLVRTALEQGKPNPLLVAEDQTQPGGLTELQIQHLMSGPDRSGGRHHLGATAAAWVRIEYDGRLGGGTPANPLRIGKES